MIKKVNFTAVVAVIIFVIFAADTSKASVVNPNQVYTYNQMQKDIRDIHEKYPNFTSYQSLGKTKYGRDIWAIKIGKGPNNIFINGSHHAREWLTTNLTMEMLDVYAAAYNNNSTINGYHVRQLLDEVSIWFVPMVNPDGVTLQQLGHRAFPTSSQYQLLMLNEGNPDFTRWKANAEGIDLNRQYPADWSNIRNASPTKGYQNYKGSRPLVTNEAKAMVDFTRQIDPEITVAYHSSGEILYWHFNNPSSTYQRDYNIAKKVSDITGYRLISPMSNPSGGGYKDWFIQEFKKPGLTPEIGRYVYERDLPLSEFQRAWDKNKTVPLELLKQAKSMVDRRTTTINKTYTLFSKVRLYHQPNSSSRSSASINPQSVFVYKKQGDWLQIKTWLGKKWIKTNDYIEGSKQKINKQYYLTRKEPLYNSPISNKLGASVKPQNLRVVSKVNNWYEIETWLGKKWIKTNNIIAAKKEKYTEQIHLTEVTSLYSNPNRVNKPLGKLKPQSVNTVARVNNWFQVKTWLGDKWINPNNPIIGEIEEISIKVTLGDKKDLYDWPNVNSRKNGAVNPQVVTAIAEINGWYQIKTWLGDKWINSKDTHIGEPSPVNSNLYIFDSVDLYVSPSTNSVKKGALGSQELYSSRQIGNWFEVDTWLGSMWIHPDNYSLFEPNSLTEFDNKKVTVLERKELFNYPDKRSKNKGAIGAQVVTAVAKYKDWYKIKTWMGPMWINGLNVIEGEEEIVQETINLTEKTTLYEKPTTDSRTKGALGAQEVKATSKLGNWYKIETWLGPLWINHN